MKHKINHKTKPVKAWALTYDSGITERIMPGNIRAKRRDLSNKPGIGKWNRLIPVVVADSRFYKVVPRDQQ